MPSKPPGTSSASRSSSPLMPLRANSTTQAKKSLRLQEIRWIEAFRRRDRGLLQEALRQIPDHFDRGRLLRERLGRLEASDRRARRQGAAGRRRPLSSPTSPSSARASKKESATRFWSRSTRSARSPRRSTPSNSPRKTTTPRSSAIAPARPRIPRSPISPSQRMPARSRRARCAEPIASPNTISSSASRNSLAPTLSTGAKCVEVWERPAKSKDPLRICDSRNRTGRINLCR